MKSVGNLNDFVRHHMLEPFDAETAIKGLVTHFEDLTEAHDAVIQARDQLALLDPLLADCDEYRRITVEIEDLSRRRVALRYFFADRKHRLLTDLIEQYSDELTEQRAKRKLAQEQVTGLRAEQRRLELERAGHGGNRLGEIAREISQCNEQRRTRQRRFLRFAELLTEVGLRPVEDALEFGTRIREVAERADETEERRSEEQNTLNEIAFQLRDANNEAIEINSELVSLQDRPSNIPARQLELRRRLCAATTLEEADLPYAGELIQVRTEEAAWEGAAERVLHGFGLSLLVAAEHYAAVSDWIDGNHLGGRVVYFRVPATAVSDRPIEAVDRSLYTKLEIKDSPFAEWIDRELRHRADYECVDSMNEFRRSRTAVTRNGQVKGGRGRHEKDDRYRIDDRRRYVLGWSNESKIEALIGEAQRLTGLLERLNGEKSAAKKKLTALERTATMLAKLVEFSDYDELNWQAMVGRIADLEAEKARIEQSSGALQEIVKKLDEVAGKLDVADAKVERYGGKIAVIEQRIEDSRAAAVAVEAISREPGYEPAHELFGALRELCASYPVDTVADCDEALNRLTADLLQRAEGFAKDQRNAGNRAMSKMTGFRTKYPLETAELDDSLESADGYRELHLRLTDDDLPRFEARFKEYLNTNTIRDIAGFHAQLEKQVTLIRERIDIINRSLVDIDYNPGRYVGLELSPTPNIDIRNFKTQLRECTSDALHDVGDQYSEQKFLQVKNLIERFRGREGQTETDRIWTKRVTDVRNWFGFAASERWREDNTEHENYTDSDGKSGGQKEKLAYTILAASLAYQFKLDWGVAESKTFRFAVIDEAFGRGSDESTRFALGLFGRLGLQLLIVTPLQKIHVIEPFVASVGFVDNKTGGNSRIQTLTIEEYRERRSRMLRGGDGHRE
ncbi:ATP-binding protein [Nocardia crassostreae]|uniref:ATP-binding protein n=1 Tax=Nocardia crassostreae TaxID=53428 RepID=UPI000A6A6537|nr:SbcC/MukB-like Walker B domain-containing protein [Nocardia crassostreae]